MKQITLLVLGLLICFAGSIQMAHANTPSPETLRSLSHTELAKPLTKKEIRKQERLKKKANWLGNLITKKIDKVQKKEEKTGKQIFDSLDEYLRLTLIFFLAAVVFAVLASLMGGIAVLAEVTAILAGASAVAAVIFFILWLAENV